ncbi:MAG TPA: 1-deoxy-D-xylulose-5-phosphate reductoisomerase [candidate division Zixibacteria bacterium]|nr:1-deoxy-D-xylulose-5-phosphate reductoisomerase [candidate division Zixibacteria bacterium]
MKKRLSILGSTGSIGVSALDIVAKNQDRIELFGLSAFSNIELLQKQVERFCPKYVTVRNKAAYEKFGRDFDSGTTQLLEYETGLNCLITDPDVDIVLNGIVGAAGLEASIETVKAGKRLALANKESMVIGGELINSLAGKYKAEIIPVDSEHSAIWQSLASGQKKELKRILLTGSGGPFRELPLEKFRSITKEQALHHPTWNMGPKITIDSATMMNKGLEVIEAVRLFDIPSDKIEIVIHPESIIHSMVEYIDSSIIAQMSNPDMRLPISYALFYPERVVSDSAEVNLADVGELTFYNPDFEKFPLLKLAFRVAETGGSSAAVMNAANEIAVSALLNNAVKFVQIPDIVINSVEKYNNIESPSLEEILEADRWGREKAKELVG